MVAPQRPFPLAEEPTEHAARAVAPDKIDCPHALRFPQDRRRDRRLLRLPQSLFAAGAAAGARPRVRRRRGRDQHHHDRERARHRADRAVHRRARRRAGPQARHHRRDAGGGGADGGRRFRRRRAGADRLALRAGPAAAADLRRHRRLYRRRVAAARRSPASPASTSRARASAASAAASCPACSPISSAGAAPSWCSPRCRSPARSTVALLLPREKDFVRSEGLGASARQMLRHLRNPQLARDLCDRLRRAVQLHRGVHLCELPPRRGRPTASPRRCSARSSSPTWSAP